MPILNLKTGITCLTLMPHNFRHFYQWVVGENCDYISFDLSVNTNDQSFLLIYIIFKNGVPISGCTSEYIQSVKYADNTEERFEGVQ